MRQLYEFMGIILAVASGTGLVGAATAADMTKKPGGFPQRSITMIVPYGLKK